MSRVVSALILCLTALFATAGTASAASTSGYPPKTCAQVLVSTTSPAPDGFITVTGSHYTPGTTVTILLHTTVYQLGTATVQADGTFSVQVQMPAGITPGHHVLTVTGGDPDCPADPIPLEIGGERPPKPPITGVDSAELLAIGLGLLALGLLINTAASRRRRRHHGQHASS